MLHVTVHGFGASKKCPYNRRRGRLQPLDEARCFRASQTAEKFLLDIAQKVVQFLSRYDM